MHLRSMLPKLLTVLLAVNTLAAETTSPNTLFLDWAPRPPMGWNSWDSFGCTVTEELTKANTDYMADKLAAHGWQYIVVDIQWYEPQSKGFDYAPNPQVTMDEWGRLWPVAKKFPSATNGLGFKRLADYVHGKGLKFGLHLLRGIPREAVKRNTPILGTKFHAADIADTNSICRWNPDMFGVDMSKPGAQEYYDSVFQLFAAWDLDFVKVDDLSRPYHQPEIEALRKAIDHSGRAMVFSTSPGDTPLSAGPHVATHANQWRVSDDFWDDWKPLKEQFKRLHDWTPFRGAGHWPDADMLPLGNVRAVEPKGWTRFTTNEQITLMTLWAIARSPLIMGGHLPKNDAFTLSLLTNDEVLAVNQRSANNRQLFRTNDLIAWVADVPDSPDKYVALFNAGGGDLDLEHTKFRSLVVSRDTPGQAVDIDVDITGATKLFLVVADGGDGTGWDHADWLEPRFIGTNGETSLTNLKWTSATSGWGKTSVGKSVGGKALIVGGNSFTNGLGTHAESVIEYRVPAGSTRFQARGGLDAGSASQTLGGTVQFFVFTTDPRQTATQAPVTVKLNELGFEGAVRVRDLWAENDLGEYSGTFASSVVIHGAQLFRFSPVKK